MYAEPAGPANSLLSELCRLLTREHDRLAKSYS